MVHLGPLLLFIDDKLPVDTVTCNVERKYTERLSNHTYASGGRLLWQWFGRIRSSGKSNIHSACADSICTMMVEMQVKKYASYWYILQIHLI